MNLRGYRHSPDRRQIKLGVVFTCLLDKQCLPGFSCELKVSTSLVCDFQFYVLPIAANNPFANFNGVFSFANQLMNKETLLETKRSADTVRGRVTIEQTGMTFAVVAHAVAGLLREDFRMLLSVAVRLGHDRIGKLFWVQHCQQRLCRLDAGKVRWNSGRRIRRRLMALLICVGIVPARRCSTTGQQHDTGQNQT